MKRYIPLIDKLLDFTENEEVTPHVVVKKLGSFLNIAFDDETRHDLKTLVRERMQVLQEEKNQALENENMIQKRYNDFLKQSILREIRRKALMELLFTRTTMKREYEYKHIQAHDNDGSERKQSNLIARLLRNNKTLLYKLDPLLNMYNFRPSQETLTEYSRLRKKRRDSRRRYKSFEESWRNLHNNPFINFLYLWDEELQNFLGTKLPLTFGEVYFSVFKYIGEKGLYQSYFVPDDRTKFILRSPDDKPDRQALFAIISTFRRDFVGEIKRDGARVLNDKEGGTIIPISKYNISKDMLENQMEYMLSQLDMETEYPKFFGQHKVRKKKPLARPKEGIK